MNLHADESELVDIFRSRCRHVDVDVVIQFSPMIWSVWFSLVISLYL